MKEIIAPDRQMCVHRRLQQVAYIVQSPDDEDSGWELLPEDEARKLQEHWRPKTDPSVSRDQIYDSERTSGEA